MWVAPRDREAGLTQSKSEPPNPNRPTHPHSGQPAKTNRTLYPKPDPNQLTTLSRPDRQLVKNQG